MTTTIFWCEICNSRPSNGVLEVIREGELETSYMHACTICVVELDEEDWIDNIDPKENHNAI